MDAKTFLSLFDENGVLIPADEEYWRQFEEGPSFSPAALTPCPGNDLLPATSALNNTETSAPAISNTDASGFAPPRHHPSSPTSMNNLSRTPTTLPKSGTKTTIALATPPTSTQPSRFRATATLQPSPTTISPEMSSSLHTTPAADVGFWSAQITIVYRNDLATATTMTHAELHNRHPDFRGRLHELRDTWRSQQQQQQMAACQQQTAPARTSTHASGSRQNGPFSAAQSDSTTPSTGEEAIRPPTSTSTPSVPNSATPAQTLPAAPAAPVFGSKRYNADNSFVHTRCGACNGNIVHNGLNDGVVCTRCFNKKHNIQSKAKATKPKQESTASSPDAQPASKKRKTLTKLLPSASGRTDTKPAGASTAQTSGTPQAQAANLTPADQTSATPAAAAMSTIDIGTFAHGLVHDDAYAARGYTWEPKKDDCDNLDLSDDDWEKVEEEELFKDLCLQLLGAICHPPAVQTEQAKKAFANTAKVLSTDNGKKMVQARVMIAVQSAVAFHRNGAPKILSDESSNGRGFTPDRTLTCHARVLKMIEVTKKSALIKEDLAKGKNIEELARNPIDVLYRKMNNKNTNDNKKVNKEFKDRIDKFAQENKRPADEKERKAIRADAEAAVRNSLGTQQDDQAEGGADGAETRPQRSRKKRPAKRTHAEIVDDDDDDDDADEYGPTSARRRRQKMSHPKKDTKQMLSEQPTQQPLHQDRTTTFNDPPPGYAQTGPAPYPTNIPSIDQNPIIPFGGFLNQQQENDLRYAQSDDLADEGMAGGATGQMINGGPFMGAGDGSYQYNDVPGLNQDAAGGDEQMLYGPDEAESMEHDDDDEELYGSNQPSAFRDAYDRMLGLP